MKNLDFYDFMAFCLGTIMFSMHFSNDVNRSYRKHIQRAKSKGVEPFPF